MNYKAALTILFFSYILWGESFTYLKYQFPAEYLLHTRERVYLSIGNSDFTAKYNQQLSRGNILYDGFMSRSFEYEAEESKRMTHNILYGSKTGEYIFTITGGYGYQIFDDTSNYQASKSYNWHNVHTGKLTLSVRKELSTSSHLLFAIGSNSHFYEGEQFHYKHYNNDTSEFYVHFTNAFNGDYRQETSLHSAYGKYHQTKRGTPLLHLSGCSWRYYLRRPSEVDSDKIVKSYSTDPKVSNIRFYKSETDEHNWTLFTSVTNLTPDSDRIAKLYTKQVKRIPWFQLHSLGAKASQGRYNTIESGSLGKELFTNYQTKEVENNTTIVTHADFDFVLWRYWYTGMDIETGFSFTYRNMPDGSLNLNEFLLNGSTHAGFRGEIAPNLLLSIEKRFGRDYRTAPKSSLSFFETPHRAALPLTISLSYSF